MLSVCSYSLTNTSDILLIPLQVAWLKTALLILDEIILKGLLFYFEK